LGLCGCHEAAATATLNLNTPGFQECAAALKVAETNENGMFAPTLEKKGFASVNADVLAALKDKGRSRSGHLRPISRSRGVLPLSAD